MGVSQTVNTPSSSSFIQNTSNQSISGFSLSNFKSNVTLLVTIGLVNPPIGTNLSLTTTTGLTRSIGYNSWSNFSRISFTGTLSNINTALSSLKLNTGSNPGNVYIAVTATENPSGYFYLPSNGHFYRPMNGSISYTNAKNNASSQTFKGQQGYLVTITSMDEQNFIHANVPVSNIWFALSDAALEGRWRIDAGPENGTLVWTTSSNVNNSTTNSYSSAGTTSSGQFTAWASGEPNNADGSTGEDHAVTKWGGANSWNDLRDGNTGSIGGYVVEFGTWTDPVNQTFTDFYSGFVTHQISCTSGQTPNPPTAINNSRLGTGTVTLSATVGTGQTVDWYLNSSGGNPIATNTTSYNTPSISTTTKYYTQTRSTTTGCLSSSRTEVTATVNINEKISGKIKIPNGLTDRPTLKLFIIENNKETLIDSVMVDSNGFYVLNPIKHNVTYKIIPKYTSYTLTHADFNDVFYESQNENTPTKLPIGLVLDSGLKLKAGDVDDSGHINISDAYLIGANLTGFYQFKKVLWFTSSDYDSITMNNFKTIKSSDYFIVNFTDKNVTLNIKYIIKGDSDLSSSSN